MAPTTLVACAASGDVCFCADQILYEVPKAFIFRERSSVLLKLLVSLDQKEAGERWVWTYQPGIFSVRSRQRIIDAMRKSWRLSVCSM